MAQIKYDYYNGQDVYNDGDVEERLLEFYREGTELDKNTDEIFYLTTHIRANILNWYPFSKSDDVLEIGSGCGTLTDTLCTKCKTVCSVEGSKRRAEITYERNKNHENLEVFAAEFGKFNLNKKFDYVVLIGVFEYAKRFFDEKKPFEFFLNEIKKVIKPTGKVIIAIENRYGLKYWAGANEDHLLMPYVGFTDYSAYDVQTFGQKEFLDLIHSVGFEKCKFYYPFPDYKLPEIIYSDERLPKKDEVKKLPIYVYGNDTNFDIKRAYYGIIDNNQFGFFSNSYIAEFGFEDATMSDTIYAKEVSYRRNDFRLVTVQKEDKSFRKIAITKDAKRHLASIYEIYNMMIDNNIGVAATELISEDELKIAYCKGWSVADYILNQIKYEGETAIKKEIEKLWKFYCSISECASFSNPINERLERLYPNETYILKMALIDGNASNLIINENGNYEFIDQEWYDERQLPAEYLLYFSIIHICDVCSIDYDYMLEILNSYGLTKEKTEVFLQISQEYFASNAVIEDYTKKKQEELDYQKKDKMIQTTPVCYFDIGNGFTEEQKLYGEYTEEGAYYTVKFEFPVNVRSVRIDPALIGEKFIKFTKILLDGKEIEYDSYNLVEMESKYLLVKKNPYVVFSCTKKEITFAIDLAEMELYEMEKYLHSINQ